MRLVTLHSLLGLVIVLGAAPVRAEDAATGAIHGHLVGEDGQYRSVGEVTAFLCDGETGYPLIAKSKQRIDQITEGFDGFSDIWHDVGETYSAFDFTDVPAGNYRIIVQLWTGVRGMQDVESPDAILLPLGTANDVRVEAGKTTQVSVPPLGTGALTLKTDPEGDPFIFFVSTAPLRCDPILGFWGWGEEFSKNIVAATHRSQSDTTIFGLPTGRDLYVVAYSYDNVMGMGGVTARADGKGTIAIPVMASWSDGKDEPPARLLPVVEYLERTKRDWVELCDTELQEAMEEAKQAHGYGEWAPLKPRLEDLVDVTGVGRFAVKDVLAASCYADLRESHHHQREQRAKWTKK